MTRYEDDLRPDIEYEDVGNVGVVAYHIGTILDNSDPDNPVFMSVTYDAKPTRAENRQQAKIAIEAAIEHRAGSRAGSVSDYHNQ